MPAPFYTMAENKSDNAATAPIGNISGGDYVWRAEASAWGGATATLKQRTLDGATYVNVVDASNNPVTLAANGQKSIGVAQGACLRVEFSGGTPTGFYSVLAGLGD